LLVPAGDDAALVGALRRLVADPALRARLGDNGRRRALEEFTIERLMRDLDGLYRRLLEARS
jgi:glycosyltransferase involved in cell wall biosynthesis